MKPLRITEDARLEWLREIQYYESKQEGLGKRLRVAVSDSFALIQRFPHGGAPGPASTRRTKVRGFPFTVVYRDEPSQLVVFAIAPDRRQPGYWLARASDGSN